MESETTGKKILLISTLITSVIAVAIALLLPFIPKLTTLTYLIYTCGTIAVLLGVVTYIIRYRRLLSAIGIALSIVAILIGVLVDTHIVKIARTPNAKTAKHMLTADEQSYINDANGTNTKKILEKDLKVDLGKFVVDQKQYLAETNLPVTLKNLSDKPASYTIKIEAVDTKGNVIASDKYRAGTIMPQQEKSVHLFRSVDQTKLDLFKSATFKVTMAAKSRTSGTMSISSGDHKPKPNGQNTPQPNNPSKTTSPKAPSIRHAR